MMDRVVGRAARFRHVVFPDCVGGFGRAASLAHAPVAPATEAFQGDEAHVTPARASQSRHYGTHQADTAVLSADAESFLCGLFGHVGLSVRHYKPETLARRLPACLRALRASSLAHARSVLQRNPHLAWEAVGALLIGVTSFFRDEAVFDALRGRVLPRLLAGCAGRRPLRVWSVGCSDGAELYSVAMLLDDLAASGVGPGAAGCELLGTDCRPAALARAAAGVFEPEAVRGVPPRRLARYFTFDGTHNRIAQSLRAAARWQAADALRRDDDRPGTWDLVLCRNVVIYLQAAATAALWTSLTQALRPGGVLVLGKAERPLGVRGLSMVAPCVYLKGAS
jgi:chemotaxis methyl-accepting protein methylase